MSSNSAYVYPTFVAAVQAGKINWVADTFKVALFTTAYDPAISPGEFYADISTHEVAAGDGYSAGGAALANPTLTVDGDYIRLDGGDPTWTNLTKTFKWGVVYRVGATSADFLVLRVDLNHAPVGVDYTIQWSNLGLLNYQIVNPA